MFRFAERHWSENPLNRKKLQDNPGLDLLFPYETNENSAKNIPASKSQNSLNLIDNHQDLVVYIQNFNDCDLKKKSKNTVIFSGSPQAKLLIIGEAPGEEEDRLGKPFVGASGKLLRTIFQSFGVDPETLYITNCVFWRPPMNRKPTIEEINICKPMVEKQIEIIKPKCILLLGAVALNMMFGDRFFITKTRGNQLEYKEIPVFVTFHPSYVLRMPTQKEIVASDIEKVVNFLKVIN